MDNNILEHLDLIFDMKHHNFRDYFNRNIMITFALWKKENPKINELLENGDFDQIKKLISDLVDKASSVDSIAGCIIWTRIMSDNEKTILRASDTIFSKHENDLCVWGNYPERESRKLKKYNLNGKLYYIGEVFMNIDRVWTLLNQKESERDPNYYQKELLNRISALNEYTNILVSLYSAKYNGGKGGKNKGSKRNKCKDIIKTHKKIFSYKNKLKENISGTIMELKQLYKEKHNKDLQKKNSKGTLTPTDKTIEKWIIQTDQFEL